MLKPLSLGKETFPINIIQGPLAGYSCAPFRRLTWQYGKPAFSCTEMISCKTIVHQSQHAIQRFIQKDPQEGPVCFQLSGQDPKELAEAVKRVTDYGANLIDLNCGCPVKKIRQKGAGSKLLSEPQKLYQLIRAMKENTSVPVSVKIRVEGGSNETFNQDIANVVSDAGVDFLIVHGRHWTEHYETPCNHDEIQFFVETLKIPVIGNGDIACLTSLKKMFATGCAGVMIARAGMGQPWLIAKLAAEMKNESFTMPTLHEIRDIFIEHVKDLIVLLQSEKFAVIQARKIGKYYARPLANRTDFCDELNRCETLQELENICRYYFTLDMPAKAGMDRCL